MLFPRTILVFLVVWHSHGLESGVVTVSSSAIHPVDDVLGTDSSELGSELSSQTQQNQQPLTRLECGIWLAPSTIPGSGLGMYAGRDFHAHEYLQEHLGDLVIPIIDIEEHASEYSTDDWKFLWDEYTWDAAPLHVDHEGFSSVNVASPGFGSAANSFLALVNVEEWSPVYDAANLHRSKDPGVGSFSPYCDRKVSAKRDIQAGEEFFVSYGEHWFLSRKHFGPVPLYRELNLASRLANQYDRATRRVPMNVAEQLWTSFITNSAWKNESRIIGSFNHDDKEELRKLKEKTLTEIRTEQSIRSLEWLEEYGTCGDHMLAKQSTIPQAGRGAFAARNLPVGTVVSHMPLIHITDRNRLVMYNLSKKVPSQDRGIMGHQLLLNYCFGHGESTLLLCPYGPMSNYVNHNATLANVMIRWADPDRGNHMPLMLNSSLETLESDATAKLAFEMVATRDINEGEEIFLDYGIEWEQAWQQHIQWWRPSEANYIPAWKLNQDISTPVRTVFETITGFRYPGNVELRCEKSFLDDEDDDDDGVEDWREHLKTRTVETWLLKQSTPLIPCEVIRTKSIDGELFYTVVMMEDDEDDDSQFVNHLVEDIPREGIKFVDRPYTSDIFLRNSFRHDIRIPDEMFPQTWRNVKKQKTEASYDYRHLVDYIFGCGESILK